MPPKEIGDRFLPDHEVYWVVWCPTKPYMPPRVKHNDLWRAENEADRLAKLNPCHEFVVLQAVNTRVAGGMVRQQFATPLPF
jgi:hypothetical protein